MKMSSRIHTAKTLFPRLNQQISTKKIA